MTYALAFLSLLTLPLLPLQTVRISTIGCWTRRALDAVYIEISRSTRAEDSSALKHRSQKAEAQARKRHWPRADGYAYASVFIVSLGLFYSVTLNVLAILPGTMCLQVVGGEGCA